MASLETYHQKRDFRSSTEPRGHVGRKRSRGLRFVVQRHDATRLHYDFRLEHDGVLKSWAVTKGPSASPAEKRLAVEVEDHPLEYGEFEGVIPEGYGAGVVQLYDRGEWVPEDGTDVAKALKAGRLKFHLKGKRRREGEKRNSWLLIKERDEFASDDADAFIRDDTSVKTGRTLDKIGKRLAGKRAVAAKTGDAVWGAEGKRRATAREARGTTKKPVLPKRKVASMPDFVAPQLARLAAAPPAGRGWLHEMKFDGYRIQARIEAGKAVLRSRNGLVWTDRFGALARELSGLPDCMLDGEVIAVGANGIADFAALQDALSRKKTDELRYFVFDLLFLEGADLRNAPLEQRKATLQQLLQQKPMSLVPFSEHFDVPGATLIESACRMKMEGIVSKRANAPYRSGRSDAWIKAKCRGGQEVVIGGWRGTGRLRSLLVGVREDDAFTYVGRVGTGFNATIAADLEKRLKALERDRSPFTAGTPPARLPDLHWVEPKLVAEVEFATWTTDGLLRQASFKGLREDKPAREITRELPRAQTKAASTAAGRISKPEKVLWPATDEHDPVTKADLAAYYELVATRLLAHAGDRPVSLVRLPDGIEGQRFFQRHGMAGMDLPTIKVAGDRQPYITLHSAEDLQALAQAAALELHPWGCRPNEPEIPDRIVFDLDPDEDLDFAEVVEAAKALRGRLEALDGASFIKTTGGKGLHVVVPITGAKAKPPSWDEAKRFAQGIATAMAREEPSRYLATASKAKRRGKIFIDYLRNARTATAVAPWSPRARAPATISCPIPWSAVTRRLDPKAFRIDKAKALLARADPWADFAEAAASLADLVKRVG
jgi:bifunctional non-homologous end joining protein LigD